jgi:hypothetical protein
VEKMNSLTFQTIFYCDQDANNVAKTKNIYQTAFQNTAEKTSRHFVIFYSMLVFMVKGCWPQPITHSGE